MDQSIVISPESRGARMRLMQWLTKLNLFESNATDEHSLQIQRWSTRVYIITLSLSLFILSIYASLQVITQHIVIEDPTVDLYEKLLQKYSVECACSNVSIPYEQFTRLTPSYHQICSSDFVTQRWINYLYNSTTTPFYYPEDFRATASQQFQLLANLCQLSAQALNDDLHSFNITKLITVQLMSGKLLDAKMQAHIDAFKKTIPSKFYHNLMLVRDFLFSNNFLPAAQTLSTFETLYEQGSWTSYMNMKGIYDLDNVYCHCYADSTCKTKAGFFGDDLYDRDNHENIYMYLGVLDEWYIGCLPINSLLFSTLKSFYNQTAVKSFLHFFMNLSSSFKSLDPNRPTRFPPSNSTINSIVSESFIENWTMHINYSAYFRICAPKLCSYVINEHFNIFYIVSVLLAVYGGFTVVLRFSIPIIIKLVMRRNEETGTPVNVSSRQRKLIRALLKLNLFKSAMHVEPFDIYKQKCSTWIYIVLLLFTFIIATIYTAFRKQIIQIDMDNPTLDKILELQGKNDISSLRCPCTQLSVPLKYFVALTPIYHEVCSSQFLSYRWIFLLDYPYAIDYADFLGSGSTFKVLRLYCDQAERTVNNTLDLLYKTQLVTMDLLKYDLFTAQINSIVHSFQLITPEPFSHSLELLRETTRVNQFISMTRSNFFIDIQGDVNQLKGNLIIRDDLIAINGSICSNIIDRYCKRSSIVITYGTDSQPIVNLVPGFFASPYSVESLLLSQPLCLYNQSFIEFTLRTMNLPPYENFTALSKASRFSHNTTFASMTNNLFIESWITTRNYTAYFEQCRPRSCSYTVNQTPTLVSLFTTMVGLFGTLSAIFRFVIPRIVTFVFACFHRQTRRDESPENVQRTGKKVKIILLINLSLLICI